MSRWRAPRAEASSYITPEGYRTLELELKELWQRRSGVCSALAAAAAEGDRSENAEYIYRKKELRAIDSRINYLQKRMPGLNIVSDVSDTSRVFFGALITLENNAKEKICYRIVGPDELDHGQTYISIDAPLARVLLGKSCHDEISLKINSAEQNYTILAVHYACPDNSVAAE